MYLKRINFLSESFPTKEQYPFNLEAFKYTKNIAFQTPVTFLIGDNGTGKSTLLRAIARKCKIHIWKEEDRPQFHDNRFTEELYRYLAVDWDKEVVPGSYFSSEIFRTFAQILDEWARSDPGILKYFGGESLVTKSHGQYHMAYFKNRYKIKGLYLLDEPENALSPKRLIELLSVLKEMSLVSKAQFIIATHSPILLAFPAATIYSFDYAPVKQVEYEETDYYQIYKSFMDDRNRFLDTI
ncbi:MAG: AAA family ATPase [Eubacteriales bacterium]|jgi:predicted ATPase